MKHTFIAAAAVLFTSSVALSQSTAKLQLKSSGAPVINRNIYGHFAEHLGHCIYGGFYVGDTSKTIPNTNGVRNDIIDALKKIEDSQPALARWLFCRHLPLERWYRAKSPASCHGKQMVGRRYRRQ